MLLVGTVEPSRPTRFTLRGDTLVGDHTPTCLLAQDLAIGWGIEGGEKGEWSWLTDAGGLVLDIIDNQSIQGEFGHSPGQAGSRMNDFLSRSIGPRRCGTVEQHEVPRVSHELLQVHRLSGG